MSKSPYSRDLDYFNLTTIGPVTIGGFKKFSVVQSQFSEKEMEMATHDEKYKNDMHDIIQMAGEKQMGLFNVLYNSGFVWNNLSTEPLPYCYRFDCSKKSDTIVHLNDVRLISQQYVIDLLFLTFCDDHYKELRENYFEDPKWQAKWIRKTIV